MKKKLSAEEQEYMAGIYKEYCGLMFAVARMYMGDAGGVEDIVAESCCGLIKNIHTFRDLESNKQKFYIVSTVRNTSLNHLVKQRRSNRFVVSAERETIEAVPDNFDVERKILLEEELSLVWRASEQLPPNEREVIRMKYGMDMADEDIAAMLALSVSSIRKYVERARKHIKEILYGEKEPEHE